MTFQPQLLRHYKAKRITNNPAIFKVSSVANQLPFDGEQCNCFVVQLKGPKIKSHWSTIYASDTQANCEVLFAIFPNLVGLSIRMLDAEGYVVRERTMKPTPSDWLAGSSDWWMEQTQELSNIIRKGTIYNAAPALKAKGRKSPQLPPFADKLNQNHKQLMQTLSTIFTN